MVAEKKTREKKRKAIYNVIAVLQSTNHYTGIVLFDGDSFRLLDQLGSFVYIVPFAIDNEQMFRGVLKIIYKYFTLLATNNFMDSLPPSFINVMPNRYNIN